MSENESIFTLSPFSNWYLIGAVTLSMLLHFVILYVPFFTRLFAITSLNWLEWKGVLLISAPVLLIDEVLKWVSRLYFNNSASQVIHQDVSATTATTIKSVDKGTMSDNDSISSNLRPRKRVVKRE